jgi:hypothetical protein
MKKLFAIAVFALAGLGMVAQDASAWCCWSCGCGCRYRIKVHTHQENAFSPICVDGYSIKSHGHCNIPFMQQQCAPACYESGPCDGGTLGHLPAAGGPAAGSAPSGPTFQAPMPTPANNPSPMPSGQTMMVPPSAAPPAFYQPTMYPPMNYPGYGPPQMYGMGYPGFPGAPSFAVPR